jgi:hypothetical protein
MAKKGKALRRVLIGLGILILLSPVLFVAAYRIAAKKLLTGPALRAEINRKPAELQIEWDEAVSTWPGRVAVKNLSIRGSDPNVQWIVILPEATLRYALSPLLRRTFVVTELRPTSIQFRIRQKLKPGQATEAQVKMLPPIPGFADPPMRVEGEKLPPPEPGPFTIEVKDVATDAFNDIWVDGFRYQGPAALRGRFRLKPGYRAQIGPASVVFSGGALKLGESTVLSETEGRFEATFAEWDVQELIDDKVWRVVTARAELSGPLQSADFLEGVLDPGPGQRFSGGTGTFALSAGIEKGVASGTVDLTAKKGRFTSPELRLVGSADAKVKFSDFNLDGGSPDISGSSVKLTDVFVADAAKGTQAWWGEFEVPAGRFKDGLTAKVTLQCKDGRPLVAFLGDELPKWAMGLMNLDGLKATTHVVFSEPRTVVRGLEASGGEFRIEGEYDRRGERSRGAFLIDNGGLLVIGVELDNGRAVVRPLLAKQWFERARPTIHDAPAATPGPTGQKPAQKKKS